MIRGGEAAELGARPTSSWRTVLTIGAVVAAIVFAVRGAGVDASRLGAHAWSVRPVRLLAATALEVALLAWGVFLWSRIVARFDASRPSYRALLRVWCGTTLAKYVPGGVWSIAATVEMARRSGASPIALPSAFVLQGALNVTGALVVAAFARRASVTPVLVVVGVAAALLLVRPATIDALVRVAARVARRDAPRWRGTWRDGVLLLALHVATWGAYGAAFALFVSGVAPAAHAPWTTLAAINALAFVAGFVAFFAPGGVGVREAALVGLLAPYVPATGARIAVAAASRLWLMLTEVVGGTLVAATLPRAAQRAATRHAVRRTSPDGFDIGPVQPLVDTRAALVDITEVCRGATRSIWIAQLAFDADCVAVDPDAEGRHQPLLDAILDTARRSAAAGAPVDVRIVLQGGLLLDTSPALRRAIAAAYDGDNVRVRTIRAFPQVMHAKLLVVDERDAFVMGASFVNGYWDGARHHGVGASDVSPGTGERPLHDVAIRVGGAAARAVARSFTELWDDARGPRGAREPEEGIDAQSIATSESEACTPCAPHAAARVIRTTPARGVARHRGGDTTILDAYRAAIAGATDLLYVESQYFSARPIARAVRDALDANPRLEVVLVLNQNPDVTGYRAWQDARLAEHDLLAHERVGVFALWSAIPSCTTPHSRELTQVFVHSKVAVVDDAWATVGTANLDGASLHAYGDDFTAWWARCAFARCRNYDVNVELRDDVGGAPSSGVARDLRVGLWSRHLGLPMNALATPPAAGWLALWRAHAAANVASLATRDGGLPRGRVLPYVPQAHPRSQLRALGIDAEAAGLALRFDPGRLDVLCNAGWVKKLFPERVRRWL